MENNKIYVGKLSRRIRESDIDKEFSKFGKIKEIELRTSYAFVEFDDEKAAEEAIDEMNGKYIDDSKIVVQLKGANRVRANDDGKGPSSKDVCYNCGSRGHW